MDESPYGPSKLYVFGSREWAASTVPDVIADGELGNELNRNTGLEVL